ncbi:MAG: aldehyde ferredoxin oxidoreductase [Chloroflexi bacterium]|nr:MAG: aldehyde ferredoxin oxidoreductase [Chloroflexota bacterium]MBL1196447.1 aldehyde ferredoxin oxidoreductase [Chloroflexota bacterium]NOH13742.1 aldehyde ferredoxin oxidoreductase family protein [Chloroflexota bacterium]
MLGGIYGKILHIDLTSGETFIEEPGEDFYRLLVGGRAFVAYLLLRDLAPNTAPLSPENPLIIAPGILQGSNLPGAGRHGIGGKSPLTGAIGSSEVGGWWGHEFKKTGYDALVIRGKADRPVYLWINDGEVEVRSAEHLWGLETAVVEQHLHEELDDNKVRVAQIGPAGENLVLYAAIMHDINRAAGRNGLGALMGSKNLKAIAVRGRQNPKPVQRSRLTAVAKWFGENYKTFMGWAAEGIGQGTMEGVSVWSYLGALPTRNFSEPVFDEVEEISGDRIYELYLKERDTCQACPVNCKQVFEHVDEDPKRNVDPIYGGAEYEAVAAFGSNCGISDALATLKANELCNAYGLDTISAGMSIAFVMECFEKGILTAQDTGGIEFQYGDADAMLQAVELIAARQGFGDVMADGVARMSARFGPETEPFNLTIKGQELPLHEPRLKHGLGVGYALAPMGADHIVNVQDHYYISDSFNLQRVNAVLDVPLAPITNHGLYEEKLQLMHNEINWQHFQDCAVSCHHFAYAYDHLSEALSGVTGLEYSIQDVLDVGARAQTLSRLFNLREGFSADDDRLPDRLMKAFSSGPLADVEINVERFDWAKRRFFELMAWDPETGVPTDECLRDLELDGLLQDVELKR